MVYEKRAKNEVIRVKAWIPSCRFLNYLA